MTTSLMSTLTTAEISFVRLGVVCGGYTIKIPPPGLMSCSGTNVKVNVVSMPGSGELGITFALLTVNALLVVIKIFESLELTDTYLSSTTLILIVFVVSVEIGFLILLISIENRSNSLI